MFARNFGFSYNLLRITICMPTSIYRTNYLSPTANHHKHLSVISKYVDSKSLLLYRHMRPSVISKHVDINPLLLTLHEPLSFISKYACVNPVMNEGIIENVDGNPLLLSRYEILPAISKYADGNLEVISRN